MDLAFQGWQISHLMAPPAHPHPTAKLLWPVTIEAESWQCSFRRHWPAHLPLHWGQEQSSLLQGWNWRGLEVKLIQRYWCNSEISILTSYSPRNSTLHQTDGHLLSLHTCQHWRKDTQGHCDSKTPWPYCGASWLHGSIFEIHFRGRRNMLKYDAAWKLLLLEYRKYMFRFTKWNKNNHCGEKRNKPFRRIKGWRSGENNWEISSSSLLPVQWNCCYFFDKQALNHVVSY